MPISPLIEVAIGLALVFCILSLVVSFITARITEATEIRGKDLKQYLRKIVGDTKVEELINLPQIQSLAPIRHKNLLGVFTGQVEPKMIEKTPVSHLVDAIFQMGDVVTKKGAVDELEKALTGWPDSPAKENLLKWIALKANDVDQLRANMTMWLDGTMEQAADQYKAHARQIVIGLALVVTLAFGVDTIDFATRLWTDAQLRAVASAKTDLYLALKGETPDIGTLIQDLGDFSFQIGWWASPGDATNVPEGSGSLAPIFGNSLAC